MNNTRLMYRIAMAVLFLLGIVTLIVAVGGWVRFFMVMFALDVLWALVVIHAQSRLLLSALRNKETKGGATISSTAMEQKLDSLVRTTRELASAYDLQLRSANEIRRESRALRAQLMYEASSPRNNQAKDLA